MADETQATSTPWKTVSDPFNDTHSRVFRDVSAITGSIKKANAALIVKSVNAHTDLVALVREMSDWISYDPQAEELHRRARRLLEEVTP